VLARGETTKRGASQGVEVLDRDLIMFYCAKKRQVGPHGKVYDFSMDKYRDAASKVLHEINLADLGSVHLFRHTAAVHYYHYESWPNSKIQERARWGTDSAQKHYTKVHLLVKNEGRATDEELVRGEWLWAKPERFGLKLPVPPLSEVFEGQAYPSFLESIPASVSEIALNDPETV
jgi:hypothetical protein